MLKAKLKIILLFIFIEYYEKSNKQLIKAKNTIKQEINISSKNNIIDFTSLIDNLNNYSNLTKQTNIIFSDYYVSKNCYDKNAYYLFEYFLNNRIYYPYYIINSRAEFYISLLKQNKTQNLIIYNEQKIPIFYQDLFTYLKDAKIIVVSYSIRYLQLIPIYVQYIKFLKINHGVKYFKPLVAKRDLDIIKKLGNKANVICSSQFEYKLLIKELNYKNYQIHNASLARFERFNFLNRNEMKKKCILVSFTYRSYNNKIFEKSEYKKNLIKFLNDKELETYLTNKNIDLIYIPHHQEIYLDKNYSQSIYKYAKIMGQNKLEYYIEKCSLLITDFSSISFDFMFQNKPVLYYNIDINDKNTFFEKQFKIEPNDTIYFKNYFTEQNLLIEKIKYYINQNFTIDIILKHKYESVFFLKKNITNKLAEIILKITEEKN